MRRLLVQAMAKIATNGSETIAETVTVIVMIAMTESVTESEGTVAATAGDGRRTPMGTKT